MIHSKFLSRVQGRLQRSMAEFLFRRIIYLQNSRPYISFTFDDFPVSALRIGGTILKDFGLLGTYYASFGLMGTKAPTGEIFTSEDIVELLANGHELGCHTFDHAHAWNTNSNAFVESIIKNNNALNKLLPGSTFRSFSYPISVPRPSIKRKMPVHFQSCRCGGQAFNSSLTDLNYLKAFFLEKARDRPDFIKNIVDKNCIDKGWLIFATHDVCDKPTEYGCSPSFFSDIVSYCKSTESLILPVSEALDAILVSSRKLQNV